jgi:large-conductance mechanosensitive channel
VPLNEWGGNTRLEKEEYMFKEFAVRENMVDMATGIIIGGAFGTIVSRVISFREHLIVPEAVAAHCRGIKECALVQWNHGVCQIACGQHPGIIHELL